MSTLISLSLECSCRFIFFQVLIGPAKATNSLALMASALAQSWVCDGDGDCADNADEDGCGKEGKSF